MSHSAGKSPLWVYPAMLAACGATVVLAVMAARSMPQSSIQMTSERGRAPATAQAAPSLAQGVQATVRAGEVQVHRTLPALSFTLTPEESLDERIPAGVFSAEFTVTFDAGATRQAMFGAHVQGGQLTIRRAAHRSGGGARAGAVIGDTPDEIILSDAAGAEPRLAMSSPIRPVSMSGSGLQTLTYEFVRHDASQTASLRALWQPLDSMRVEPLPSSGAPLLAGAAQRGALVFQTHGCAACHPSRETDVQTRLRAATAPNLGRIGDRARPEWLRRWLLDPAAVKAHTTMPALAPTRTPAKGESDAWADDLTHFLVSLGGPLTPSPTRAPADSLVATGRIAYHTVGCVACHGPLETLEDLPGQRTTRASRSWQTYVEFQDLAAKTSASALSSYLLDPLAAHPGGEMPSSHLTQLEADAIAAYLIERTGASSGSGAPASPASFTLDPQRVERGRALFVRDGCNRCHAIGDAVPSRAVDVIALESLAEGTLDEGCLHDRPPAGAPRYQLSAGQTADLKTFIRQQGERACTHVPWDELGVELTRMRCTACHAFHAHAGPEAAIRPYFETDGEADLGDEGRLPPPLTDAGARVSTMWMRDVLGRGSDDDGPARARPYIATRMGYHGDRAVQRVPDLLASAAGATALLDGEPEFTLDAARAGRELVGSAGLNCIQCHEIAGHPSTGTPGPDLALMPGRLRYEHFERWLIDPAQMRPGTRMPNFFVAGRSPVESVLGGRADDQVAAMWSYLSQGEQLALPEGLTDVAGMELVVEDEPIVFRTFMKHAGVRAIACGFPEQVHCAFDADRCLITAVWQGQFLSAAGAWAARGGSETNPLAVQWTAPEGAPLTMDGSQADVELRFRGYRLDQARRPVFMYDASGAGATVRVEVQPMPTGERTIERRMTFTGAPGTRIGITSASHTVVLDADGRGVFVEELVPAGEETASEMRP